MLAAKTEISMPLLYYVRHGETDLNIQGRLQGRRDTVLNAHGRQQAAECGAVLNDLFAREQRRPQDFAYVSSPLKRAREKLKVIAGHANGSFGGPWTMRMPVNNEGEPIADDDAEAKTLKSSEVLEQ